MHINVLKGTFFVKLVLVLYNCTNHSNVYVVVYHYSPLICLYTIKDNIPPTCFNNNNYKLV